MNSLQRSIKVSPREMNTEDFLKKSYEFTKRSMSQKLRARDTSEKQAKKLEEFFQSIQNRQLGNPIENIQMSELLDALEQINPQLFNSMKYLFTTPDNYGDSNDAHGKYFEGVIAEAVATAENYFAGNKTMTISGSSKKAGTASVNLIDLAKNLDEDTKNLMNDIYQKTAQEMKKDSEAASSTIKGVSGKADIIGIQQNYTIQKTSHLELDEEIYDALLNATFTAKNYMSNTQIELGSTNPFRVFMTMIPLGGATSKIQRYYRMLACKQKHFPDKHPDAPKYFYRLRAIYELTGGKSNYTNTVLNKLIGGNYTKFLVLNLQGYIRVIPTQSVIKELIDNIDDDQFNKDIDWQKALYGRIRINQNKFSEI